MAAATRRWLGRTAILMASISLSSVLFWSWSGCLFGVAAFLLVLVGVVTISRDRRLPLPESKTARIIFAVLVASLIALALSARSGGVGKAGGRPIYAARERYFLTNHGRETEVSRLRFLCVGTSFMLGWHAMIALGAATLMDAD
jgi:hypothetical protein